MVQTVRAFWVFVNNNQRAEKMSGQLTAEAGGIMDDLSYWQLAFQEVPGELFDARPKAQLSFRQAESPRPHSHNNQDHIKRREFHGTSKAEDRQELNLYSTRFLLNEWIKPGMTVCSVF